MVESEKALIVQSDRTLMLEVHAPGYAAARDALARFAELEKSPEHVHTYRITSLSLWNAAASGMSPRGVCDVLDSFARYGVPANVIADIHELMGRFGKLRLLPGGKSLTLEIDDASVSAEIRKHPQTAALVCLDGNALQVDPLQRGTLKQRLARLGYPVDDRVGFVEGANLPFALRGETLQGLPFALRNYQREAVHSFVHAGQGHGVLALPCGSGKTVIGIGAAAELQCETLILCTNLTAARQWIREILDKTTLTREQVGEYSGAKKEIRPITVATYHILSRRSNDTYTHFALFASRAWGLVIYDEVHLLPAPVFRITAELQTRRRLGLTATLVREDGLEADVFALIGPKRYEVPWKEMEKSGFIAQARCARSSRLPATVSAIGLPPRGGLGSLRDAACSAFLPATPGLAQREGH